MRYGDDEREGRDRRDGATVAAPRQAQPNANRKPFPWLYAGAAVLIVLSLGFWLASC